MIVLGVFICSFLFILHYYLTRNFNYWKNKNVKGPKPVPLFGNFKDATLRREVFSVSFKKIYDDYRDEPIVGIYRMTTPWLMIKDLNVIKYIMIKDFDIFENRAIQFTKKGLGANLFSADAETWRVLRHQFTPLFTTGKLKNMMHLILERADKFLDYVDTVTSRKPEQKVHKLLQLYTASTIAACAFGIDVDISRENSPFFNSLRRVDTLIFSRRLVQDFIVMYPSLLKKLNVTPFPQELTDFFKRLVTTVIKERNGMPTNRNDFMDLLLELKNKSDIVGRKQSRESKELSLLKNKSDIVGPKPSRESKELSLAITEEVIAAQAFVFYSAGYETSATTMTFMLYELAMNRHIQDKLVHEIDEVLKKCNGKITYDTLSEFPYMEKVFDETLRKYPLGDPLHRRAKCDYKIPGTNVTIEQGQTVIVPLRGIHHDDKIYPKPDVFDPERFDPKVSAERHPYAYIPFGTGPRNCIGMRFAKVKSRICTIKLLSRYRIEPAETKEIIFDANRIMIAPQKGFKLKFILRNNKKLI